MEIIELKGEEKEFRDFLDKEEHLVFHTSFYKRFIEEAFKGDYKLLAAKEGGEIKTVLPLVEVKSRLLGNKIISSAYLEYGGFCGEEGFVKELISFINDKYKLHNYLEIRGGLEKFDRVLSERLIRKNLYKRFVLKLGKEEEVWKGIQESKRKAVKKALKAVEVKEIPFSDLEKFYELYCRNMKRFGSPPYGKRYFRSFYKNIVENNLGRILGAYHQGKLVSALLGFYYKGRVHIVIAVSEEKFLEYRPNDAVHWEFIKWAINKGFKWFDFGRVREESGQFEYKRKWGPELLELPSYFLLWKGKEVPVVEPENYGFLVKIWKFLPLWMTKLIGPGLRKGLGI